MRNTSRGLTAAVALAVLLSGCGGAGMQSAASVPTGNGLQSHVTMNTVKAQHSSGAALQAQYKQPTTQLNMHPNAIKLNLKQLAVSDLGTGGVEILNKSGKETGKISSGLDGPDGDWYDKKSNLYVANYTGVDVQEYAPKATKPTFTYSAGLIDPVGVTTDAEGNVFVADYDDGGSSGTITEYAQKSNTAANQCLVGGAADGVAVDTEGDVFASYNGSSGGALVEFKGGLQGCTGTKLGASLNYAGGLILDKKSDLVACDQSLPAIDIIKPPYSSVSSTITGFIDPFHVALNAKNTLLFVADPAAADVVVDKYPSGSSYATLGSSHGLSDPAGVAVH
jgi:hypothetical protein